MGLYVVSLILILASVTHAEDVMPLDTTFANNMTDFALKLYNLIADQPDATNIFFSPYSISAAMGMLYAGSGGETKKQIAGVLGYPNDMTTALTAAKQLQALMFKQNDNYKLTSANKLYVNKGYEVLQSYIDNLKSSYDAEYEKVEFGTNSDEVREEINDWVEDKTNNNIRDLFEEGTITSATMMVLVNALYFKADWLLQFQEENTKTEEFTVSDAVTLDVSMMKRNNVLANMFVDSEKKLSILEMLYKGEKLAMYIILPDEGQDINDLDLTTSSELNQLITKMRPAKVNISLPKFEVTQNMPLPDLLKNLGITNLFTGAADLSAIDSNGGLFVSDIVHQSYITISEEGTEAAAATGIIISRMSPPERNFIINRPFFIIIRDKDTNTDLFMGRITNPSTAKERLKLRIMRSVDTDPGSDDTSRGVMYDAGILAILMTYLANHMM